MVEGGGIAERDTDIVPRLLPSPHLCPRLLRRRRPSVHLFIHSLFRQLSLTLPQLLFIIIIIIIILNSIILVIFITTMNDDELIDKEVGTMIDSHVIIIIADDIDVLTTDNTHARISVCA
eukprot:GHVU01030189.1.p1 GENE.GHVU01030189.1~~GHVU01030189.1.p1  ORF type:complete len:120 (+),score=10.73 GHVU01030189.1:92-451(+)